MNSGDATLFFILIITAILPIGLIFQFSNWGHSRFRSRLWHLRDSLVDDLIDGKIEFGSGAAKMLALFETHIRNTRRHAFSDLLLAVVLLREVQFTSITDDILGGQIGPTDRKALREYFNKFTEINLNHLLRSSPSGWLVFLATGVYKVFSRRRAGDTTRSPKLKQVVRVELKAMPELIPPKRRYHQDSIDDATMAHVH